QIDESIANEPAGDVVHVPHRRIAENERRHGQSHHAGAFATPPTAQIQQRPRDRNPHYLVPVGGQCSQARDRRAERRKPNVPRRRRSRQVGRYNAVGMKTVADTEKQRWERETLGPALEKSPERARTFTTISGRPIDRLYTSEDVAGLAPPNPGDFPYTRGIHP